MHVQPPVVTASELFFDHAWFSRTREVMVFLSHTL